MKKVLKKIKDSKNDLISSAEYAPIFRFFVSKQDVFIDFAQPKMGSNNPLIVSRIVMTLKTAKIFAKSLDNALDNVKKEIKK